MSIWTSSKVVVGLILGLSLAACDTGGEGFSLFGQADPKDSGTEQRRNVALSSAEMMRGQVSLSPPSGFCIDKRSLKQNFAILARCDSLGGKGGSQEAPLGMILVSIAPVVGTADLNSVERHVIGADADVLQRSTGDNVSVVQVRGQTPSGTAPVHWRGFAQLGPHVLSLTAYAPEGGAMAGAEGGAILRALIDRTTDNTVDRNVSATTDSDSAKPRAGLGGLLSGLFD